MAQQVYYPLIKHGFQEKDLYSLPVAGADTLGGVKVGSGLSMDENGVLSADGGGGYTLPVAAADTLGGVKVGSGLSIDENGVLSGSSYTLPVAGANTLGGIKVGSGLSIDANGVLSASGGGSTPPHLYHAYLNFLDSNIREAVSWSYVFNNLLFLNAQINIAGDPTESNIFSVTYDSDYSDVFTVEFLESYPYSAIAVDSSNNMRYISNFMRTTPNSNELSPDTSGYPIGTCYLHAVIPVAFTLQ